MSKKQNNKEGERISREKMEEIMGRIGSTITQGQIFRILEYYMFSNGFKRIECEVVVKDDTYDLEYECIPFNFAERHQIMELTKKDIEKLKKMKEEEENNGRSES